MGTRLFLTTLATTGLLALADPTTAGRQAADPRVVEITARRFAFEPSVVDAVAGERLRLVVRSADGPHGIEIKALKVKKEIPRGGDPVVIEFTPGAVGRFPILCSTYCGEGHGDMAGMLVVTASPSP